MAEPAYRGDKSALEPPLTLPDHNILRTSLDQQTTALSYRVEPLQHIDPK